jgi:hypothetical protein
MILAHKIYINEEETYFLITSTPGFFLVIFIVAVLCSSGLQSFLSVSLYEPPPLIPVKILRLFRSKEEGVLGIRWEVRPSTWRTRDRTWRS